MKILVGKTFGIGNCIMAVPMIKALATLGEVNVLVGSSNDDVGAFQVMNQLLKSGIIGHIYVDAAVNQNGDLQYHDVAVMAIPFDGRWRNGIHYHAGKVLDTRPRPEFSAELGFASWKKHEVEYQMENAYELGYVGNAPSMKFYEPQGASSRRNLAYIGLGYKRDKDGFWKAKHWGNENYIAFIKHCRKLNPHIRFYSTGNMADGIECGFKIEAALNGAGAFGFKAGLSIEHAFETIEFCDSYFGNDTGMMHAAAAAGKKVYAVSAFESGLKNRPWCDNYVFDYIHNNPMTPEQVAEKFLHFVYGDIISEGEQ